MIAGKHRKAGRHEAQGFGHPFKLGSPPVLTPSHHQEVAQSRNAFLDGVNGLAPDPVVFRRYMMSRCWRGHIPTLLKDWVTAHPDYRGEAAKQVREWVEENRHLFKRAKEKL